MGILNPDLKVGASYKMSINHYARPLGRVKKDCNL
jgi:hypothetical protein